MKHIITTYHTFQLCLLTSVHMLYIVEVTQIETTNKQLLNNDEHLDTNNVILKCFIFKLIKFFMYSPNMPSQISPLTKTLVTKCTNKCFLPGVGLHMSYKIVFTGEHFTTNVTRMSNSLSHVPRQV